MCNLRTHHAGFASSAARPRGRGLRALRSASLLVIVVGSLTLCSCKKHALPVSAPDERSGKTAVATFSEPQWTYFRFVRDSLVELRNDHGDTLRMSPVIFHQIAHEHAAFEEFDTTRLAFGFEPTGKNLRLVVEQRPLVMAASVMILITFGLALALIARQRRRLKEAVREQQHVNRQRQLAELSREAERKRLARELHDGPLQDLYALRMQLASATPDPTTNDEMILGIAGELRTLTEELRTTLLHEYGLAEALREFARQYERRNQVHVEVDADELPPLPEAVSTALYRIVQEACSNAVRHGLARTIRITLRLQRGTARMTVADDGTGFEVPASLPDLAARGHFGLLGQQERVDALKGSLSICSAFGSGTRIQVEIPVLGDTPVPVSPSQDPGPLHALRA